MAVNKSLCGVLIRGRNCLQLLESIPQAAKRGLRRRHLVSLRQTAYTAKHAESILFFEQPSVLAEPAFSLLSLSILIGSWIGGQKLAK